MAGSASTASKRAKTSTAFLCARRTDLAGDEYSKKLINA